MSIYKVGILKEGVSIKYRVSNNEIVYPDLYLPTKRCIINTKSVFLGRYLHSNCTRLVKYEDLEFIIGLLFLAEQTKDGIIPLIIGDSNRISIAKELSIPKYKKIKSTLNSTITNYIKENPNIELLYTNNLGSYFFKEVEVPKFKTIKNRKDFPKKILRNFKKDLVAERSKKSSNKDKEKDLGGLTLFPEQGA